MTPAGVKDVSVPSSVLGGLLGRVLSVQDPSHPRGAGIICDIVFPWPAGAKSGSIPPSLSGGLPGGGGSAEAFVKRLKKDLELRQGVAHVLREQFLVGSGDEQVSQWLRDEGCMSTLDQVRKPSCSHE